jgi:hypothetical protein
MVHFAHPVAALMLLGAAPPGAPSGLAVEDIFGRSLNGHGMVLVDWEGQIANPVVRVFVVPPEGAAYPARAVVTAREPRVYFDLPSTAGPRGPRKELEFKERGKAPVAVAIFPDRDTRDEDHRLEVEFTDAAGKTQSLSLPVHVIDQDRDRPPAFRVLVDFEHDRTGFFRDESRRAVVLRAANDWADFLDGSNFRPTPAGAERTFLWDPDGFKTGRVVTNAEAYTGYLLYAYGIESPALRSGGEPSRRGGFHTGNGEPLPIRRSGGLEVETQGNYNTKGWLVSLDDADWWQATNLRGVKNDLYSIAHHEIGHALVFNPANTRFGAAKLLGKIRAEGLTAYLGTDPRIDRADHLHGTIDPASLKGAFGFEYHGKVPLGRWLITRTDLLCARAIGYTLRETSAFAPLTMRTDELPAGSVVERYAARLRASGGIPFYCWEVVDGALPDGLELNTFTGEIRGVPKRAGSFAFTVRVRDYDEKGPGKSRRLRIQIRSRES